MKIEKRGKPPYKVSSGSIPDVPESPLQYSSASDYRKAFEMIFNLTDGGRDPHDEFIIDSEGNIIFSAEVKNDVEILKNADKAGFLDIDYVNRR
jgi:hypothetical protein